MTVQNAARGNRGNGKPAGGWYVYGGTGQDQMETLPQLAEVPLREQQPRVADRVLAALRKLGGEASTTEIRVTVELDGGPAFEPGYLPTALGRLARTDPPGVVLCGRERGGKGRAARWRLGAGADGAG